MRCTKSAHLPGPPFQHSKPLPTHAGDAIALACAGSTHLTALQVSFPSYNYVAPAVPAWHALSALTALRRLHVGTGVGWDGAALAAVAGAATALRELTITDNADLGAAKLKEQEGVGCRDACRYAGPSLCMVACSIPCSRSGCTSGELSPTDPDRPPSVRPSLALVSPAVDERWVAALPALRQLSRLELNSCRQLGAGAAPLLAQLTALTRLACFRCNGMGAPEVQHQLRAALPCLARLDVHE